MVRLRPRPFAAMVAELLKQRISVDQAAHSAAMSELNLKPVPTEAQREAGNYGKGHTTISGLRLTIEVAMGMRRRPEWPPLTAHYGYVIATEGNDGDNLDVFIANATPRDWAGTVYVVHQYHEDGTFDEHKCMLGFDTQAQAERCYLSNYTADWVLGPVVAMSWADFKAWAKSGDTKRSLVEEVTKTWTQSASATSGITAYTTGRRPRRRKMLY